MSRVLAVLAPGQGAQRKGFLAPWLDEPGIRAIIEQLADAAETNLVAAGTIMSDSDIADTAIAQPLLVAANLASAGALGSLPAATMYAGHSVGEFAAATLAGILDPATAMRLIAVRGRAMAAASRRQPSGMAAVLGGAEADVLTAIDRAGCVAANYNGAGQIVAAGTAAALDRLGAEPPVGARVRRLPVAGAFHTDLMRSAQITLAEEAEWVSPADSTSGVLSNQDGTLVTDGEAMLARLIAQVCQPVRWDACTNTLATLGVTAVIELAPGGTLTGMLRRSLPGLPAVALRSPDDLPAARELIAEHAEEIIGSAPSWRLLIAPEGGTVRIPETRTNPMLAVGDVVVHVATRSGQLAVAAAEPGRLIELLVHDGDPVSCGQPLARVGTDQS